MRTELLVSQIYVQPGNMPLIRRRSACLHRPTIPLAFGQTFVHFRTFCEPNLSTIVPKGGSNTQIGTIADKHTLRWRSHRRLEIWNPWICGRAGPKIPFEAPAALMVGPCGGGGGRDTVFDGGHPPPRAILGRPPHGWTVCLVGGGRLEALLHGWARGRKAVVQRKSLVGWPPVYALLVPPTCAGSR